MPPIPSPKEKPKLMLVCNQGEIFVESKEIKQNFTLVVKEEVAPSIKVPKKMKVMLEEFERVIL